MPYSNLGTAYCPKCKFIGSLAKAWKIPVREEDEYGKKGRIIAFEVHPSGCLCEPYYQEKVSEKEGYKLNLMPSFRKLGK
jgi:hypothetical protein